MVKTKIGFDKLKYRKRAIQVCILIVGLYLAYQIASLVGGMGEINNPDANAVAFDVMILIKTLIWAVVVISAQIIINKTLFREHE